MKLRQWIGLGVVLLLAARGLAAQQADSIASTNNPALTSQSVPRLILFSGTVKDLAGKPLTGPVDLNFAIYKEQADAAPLWQESQTLNVDEQGHYTAILGAMQPEGLPVDLFTSGEARWLGVSAGKLPEQPRVLLVSVPYALKANDAEMLAGKPASAYALAPPAGTTTSQGPGTTALTGPGGAAASELATPGKPKSGPKPNLAGGGTVNYIPLWTDSAGTLGNSVMFQSSGLVGVGTATPGVALDVYGASAGLRLSGTGTHQLTVTGATSGRLGQDAAGFFFSSDTNGAALRFGTNNGSGHEWLRITSAGKVGIGTTTPGSPLEVDGTNTTQIASVSQTGAGNGLVASTAGSGSSTAPLAAIVGTATGSYAAGVEGISTGNHELGVLGTASGPSSTAGLFINTGGGDLIDAGTSLNSETPGVFYLSSAGNLSIAGSLSAGAVGSNGTIFSVSSAYGLNLNSASGSEIFHVDSTSGMSGVSSICVQSQPQAGCMFSVDSIHGNVYAGGNVNVVGTGQSNFSGNLNVGGTLSVGGTKNFKIDDPLDPDHKFLYHASVESSEMMNIYTGNVTTDTHGDAVVELPAWFQALNRDFRYQLTVIGQFAQAIVAQEIENNRFTIRTDKANVKVSWLVTGVRHDAYANDHPLQVEVDKPERAQ